MRETAHFESGFEFVVVAELFEQNLDPAQQGFVLVVAVQREEDRRDRPVQKPHGLSSNLQKYCQPGK